MRTYVYIDGFNFYYGAVKDTRFRWLDFRKLFQTVLDPRYGIEAIKYFTALVSALPDNPKAPDRQKIYLKALKHHLPELQLILGQFKPRASWMPFAEQRGPQIKGRSLVLAHVMKLAEKGSDVNLAIHLVNDAWANLYDAAVVVSNDSDLAGALEIVRDERKKEVVLLTPPKWKDKRSRELLNSASRAMTIKNTELAVSLLPDVIPGTSIHKPPSW